VTSLKATIGASVLMWGPPVGGIAHIDVVFVSFDIDFGAPRPKKAELLGSWEKFCQKFLNMSGSDRVSVDTPVKAFPIVQPNLAGGASSLNNLPHARRAQQAATAEDQRWKVRADEVELAASTVVPVVSLNVGRVATNSPLKGVQDRAFSGQSMMVPKAVVLEQVGLRTQKANPLGVHPMGKKLESVLNVTLVREDGSAQPDLSGWTFAEERGALPAALWDSEAPNLKKSEPSAKLIDKCITGIKRLKPPSGTLGPQAPLPQMGWQVLDRKTVTKSKVSQDIPAQTRSRDVQIAVAEKRAQQKAIVEALRTAGFQLNWQTPQTFRELQADPLAGAVAPKFD
jgi:uncharacterized protein DUF6603